MTDRDDPAHVEKKRFTRVGDTVKADEKGEAPPGDRIIHVDPARLHIKAHPATITFTTSGTLQAATMSAQRMLALIDPQTPDMTAEMETFIKAAKKKDEVHVKTIMASKNMTFASIGLDTGALTEEDGKLTLEHYYEHNAKRIGFLHGVVYTAIPSLLLGAAALLKLFTAN